MTPATPLSYPSPLFSLPPVLLPFLRPSPFVTIAPPFHQFGYKDDEGNKYYCCTEAIQDTARCTPRSLIVSAKHVQSGDIEITRIAVPHIEGFPVTVKQDAVGSNNEGYAKFKVRAKQRRSWAGRGADFRFVMENFLLFLSAYRPPRRVRLFLNRFRPAWIRKTPTPPPHSLWCAADP